MSAYQILMEYQHQTEALSKIAARLDWDQETMMPSGAISDRAQESAALEKTLHARRSSSKLGELLAAARQTKLAGSELRQVQLIEKSYQRNCKVPAEISVALAGLTSKSQHIWAQARADEAVEDFTPILAEVVALRQQEAAALADGTGLSLYDALLKDYEPDGSTAEISKMFEALRSPLVALRSAVLECPPAPELQGKFDPQLQLKLSQELAECFGYNMACGRIDRAVHPFCSGTGADVRITTRTDSSDPLGCFYSTIHEVGHGNYEQNIDQSYAFTPIGHGCSMGVHESQSRICENQLGRSEAFTSFLYGRMRDAFGSFGVASERQFYQAVNRVSRGYIRTEADELQYNLHVMMRFDLERDLISGQLAVSDLEAAWNDRFLSDFGYAVDRPSHGMLQDVHWSIGLFGYFPTYSLGNVYAGCLYESLTSARPNLDTDLASGNLGPACAWLKQNVQQYGNLLPAHELMTAACGEAPSEAAFLRYIEAKFSDLYDLA